MTMNMMTIGLTTRNRCSRRVAKRVKTAISQATRRGGHRRKLIEELSRNLPRNCQPKRKHLKPFSPQHLRTKISRFWPPLVELPSQRVVRRCRVFYQPKCPVSRLFLGHRKTRKKRAGRVPATFFSRPRIAGSASRGPPPHAPRPTPHARRPTPAAPITPPSSSGSRRDPCRGGVGRIPASCTR